MLLTITHTPPPESGIPATDLGYLLHKNPAGLFEKELTFGTARVLYPEATPECCTAALLVEVDPVGFVRNNRSATLAQYVSDRPYVPSSFLSVAINECFGTALGGRSKDRPELAATPLSLSATLTVLDCDGGEPLIRRLFEPLGYSVEVTHHGLLDDRFPEWGDSDLYDVTLTGAQTVQALLTHLYVLIPVLDNAKHYGIGEDEVEKLVRRGEGWLPAHPAKDLIALRYLRYRRRLADDALARLAEVEEVPDADAGDEVIAKDAAETALESPTRLNDRRIEATLAAVRSLDPPARRIIDLGCGEGKTLAALLKAMPSREMIAGMDVSSLALKIAARRLHLDRMSERERATVDLFQGSLVYRDSRLAGYDCALLNEVIEHLDADRLRTLERVVFEFARLRRVIVTTPNAEYNRVWPSLPAGKFRHPDHRFEWTRAEFQAWAQEVAATHGYTVAFSGIGDEDADGHGTPTQMAVFDRAGIGK
jgi:3' terminal RNA ribose 2'-O-methyltransferase Hen1